MGTKVIYMVLAGVFGFAWYYTGLSDHYMATGGGIAPGWYFTTIFALALGAGESGDAGNPVEAIMNGLKSFVPAFVALIVAALVSRLIFETMLNPDGFEVSGVIRTISTVAAAGVITVLVMTCLKRAK